MPNKYKTTLTPEEEYGFQDWYRKYASIHDLNKDPDAPEHYYDYRGYGKNGPEPMSLFTLAHLPDTGKTPGHPTFSEESIYREVPTIEDLADFTGGFETFSATPYVLKTSSGKDQTLAGYGSANPEIIKLAQEGKLTKDIAKKEMIRRLQFDYDEGTRLLPEFSNLPEEVKLALVDTSYNGKGVQGTIKNSPNLIALLKSGVTDGKQIASHLTHSKSANGWLGVRSAARRAMAQGKYDGKGESLDKFGRQVDYNQYKGPKDGKSSPYYNKYQQGGNLTYTPFFFDSNKSNGDSEDSDQYVREFLEEDNQTSSFPVEPVRNGILSSWRGNNVQEEKKVEQPTSSVGTGKVYKESEKKQFKSDLYDAYSAALGNREFNVNGEIRKLNSDEVNEFAKRLTAQDALESRYGQSTLSKYFNFGGVKDFRRNSDAANMETNEFNGAQTIRVKQPFRKFKDLNEYINYKIDLLNNNNFNVFSYLPEQMFNRLVTAKKKYATAQNYEKALNAVYRILGG